MSHAIDLSADRRTFLGAVGAASLTTMASASLLSQALPQEKSSFMIDPEKPGRTQHTKFAINIEMWFGDLPFADRIRATADLGFQYVEFWPWRNKDLAALKLACKETGVQVTQFTAWGFVPGMNDPKNEEACIDEVAASCKIANEIGAPMMTVIAGNDIAGVSKEAMHAQAIKVLKRLAPIAEKYNVMLILESMNIRNDHKGHCLWGSPDPVRICREVNSPFVKINWDLYHMQISEGDLCRRLREGIDQVGYIQVADNPGRMEPGTGEIAYARVYKELIELGYTKPVGVECSPSGDPKQAAYRLAQSDIWS
ncbi:MAG: hypothetical protein EXS10_08355 [Phycisphaerales bacterium]|nr:hypothetical protein [Phycisphaerales bacterium]